MDVVYTINNYQEYIYEIRENVLVVCRNPLIKKEILEKIKPEETEEEIINEEELKKLKLQNSRILSCVVRKNKQIISSSRKRYKTTLIDIWETMPTQRILQSTTFNMKLGICNEKGYHWSKKLNLSVQNKDSNGCMIELLNMIHVNNLYINLKIKLKTNKVVKFVYKG